MKDWIEIHYSGKEGNIFTEFKEVGKFLENEINAKFIEEIKTETRVYYKYSVFDLDAAYRRILWSLKFI